MAEPVHSVAAVVVHVGSEAMEHSLGRRTPGQLGQCPLDFPAPVQGRPLSLLQHHSHWRESAKRKKQQ